MEKIWRWQGNETYHSSAWQGAVGLAIWVASIAKDKNFPALQLLGSVGIRTGVQATPLSSTGYHPRITGNDPANGGVMRVWRKQSAGDIELCTVEGQPGPEMILEDELLDTLKVCNTFFLNGFRFEVTAPVSLGVSPPPSTD